MPVAAPIAGGLAAGAAGALLGGGGSKQQQVTTNSAPWEGVQPYLRDLFSRSQGLLNSGQLAQTSPYIGQAVNAASNTGLVNQAQGQLGRTLGGDYLSASSNPYLQGAVQQALDQVRASTSGVFNGDNFRSSANQEYLTKLLANTALPIYAQNYANERQNQLNATTAAPGLSAAPAAQLAQAAQLDQARLDSPYTALSRYQGLISGQPGGSSTTPYFTNPGASALGGALGGLQLYNAFGGPVLMKGLFGGGGGSFGGADIGGVAPGAPY